MENSIRWFVEEFKDDEDVGLILKTSLMNDSLKDHEHVKNRVSQLLSPYTDRKCKVYLLHGDMSREQLSTIYKHENTNALINFAHGEGFGLPMFEAAYHELPVITVGWSGQLDFLTDTAGEEKFYSVEFTMQPIQKQTVFGPSQMSILQKIR